MFNPFYLFTSAILEKFVETKHTFFVRQLFERGLSRLDPEIKTCFLFTQYQDLPAAQHHIGAISNDKYLRIYNYSNKEDRERLLIAVSQFKTYKIFCNVFENNWEKHITKDLKIKVKYYIDNRLGWKPKSSANVNFTIFTHYGEVYGRIKFDNHEERIKLEDIEKIKL